VKRLLLFRIPAALRFYTVAIARQVDPSVMCLARSGFDVIRQDECRHGAVGEVAAVRGDVSML
jgi:hypothetical protein